MVPIVKHKPYELAKVDHIRFIVSMNSYLASDVLLDSKVLLGYEEALWPKKLEITHASQNFVKRSSDFCSFLLIIYHYYCILMDFLK